MNYCLVSLGCQMNLSDAERVGAVLEAMGYRRTESEEDADILGLVACSVRQRPIDRAYSKIRKWNAWKRERNLLTFATGCVLPEDRERFLSGFDLFFPITELPDLPDMVRQYGVVTPVGDAHGAAYAVPHAAREDERGGFWLIEPAYASPFEAYVPIQNGCDKFCSYCAVPYTRGREISRPSAEILREVGRLVEAGYASVTLLGQNVNSYGLDGNGGEIGFAELLRRVGEVGAASGREFWIYFTSPHPRDMTEEVVRTVAAYPCLAKQFHLPLQSGDDDVLVRMNRKHTMERYREVVACIRRLTPQATLFTDAIVGFPGETEPQFERTRQAMREFAYNMAYIAMYSPRPGALSSRWVDDIPRDEKRRRLHELSGELRATSRAHNLSLVGRTVRVLVNGRDRQDGFLSAKTEGRLIVRFRCDDGSLVGRFADVRITSAADLSLEGELASAGSAT